MSMRIRPKARDRGPHRADRGISWAHISSVVSALTAACALVISGVTAKTTMDGQITTRYSAAVEQLGSPNPVTRTGAVHALARLAKDSTYDRPAIIDLLADYVRASIGVDPTDRRRCYAMGAPPMDVGAALHVLFHTITRELRDDRVDLRGVCLRKTEFLNADLTCMLLDNAVIDRSDFIGARLAGASLQHAELRGNDFRDADFTGAVALNAKFGGTATLSASIMPNADLSGADFTQADLAEVDLRGADLVRTKLTGADFTDSEVAGATLATYLGDAMNLPPGIDRSKALDKPPPPSVTECP
ncbi:pentapeptide repeat-containing protein [Actinoplanes sp. NPDC024001]|uniref:pentapeptide repeat-containing protein n=1 Tax=Actinoplanes sp. NPDC024001 TaxID=3154598 RepID=UPI003404ED8D